MKGLRVFIFGYKNKNMYGTLIQLKPMYKDYMNKRDVHMAQS